MKYKLTSKHKENYDYDIFTVPLTKRGYLLEESFNRVFQSCCNNYKDKSLMYVASILYLYGADFRGIFTGFVGKIPKGKENVVDYKRTPSIYFTFRNKPIIYKTNEIQIISNEIKKLGYSFWYPIGWVNQEGKKIRSVVEPILEKDNFTSGMINWNKKYEKFCDIVGYWYTDFLKNNKEKYDFELKAYKNETNLNFIIIDKKIKKMNSKEILVRQKQYSKLFNDFAEYLYKGFLSNEKGFPKCIYE